MRDSEAADRLQLEVPADAGMLATIRLFVAAAARIAHLGEDAIQDLKLAVSEAASAVVVSGHPGPIAIVARLHSGGMTVEVSPVHGDDLTGDQLRPGDIVRALFPDARLDAARSALVIPAGGEAP